MTINVRKVFKALRDLGNKADMSIDNLNRGGCCVFAAEVAEKLQQQGFEVRLVEVIPRYESRSDASLDYIREMIQQNNESPLEKRNWESYGASFWHVAVQFKIGNRWYTYDSNTLIRGKIRFGMYRVVPGFFTVEEGKAFAKSPTWNEMFNRRQIPRLRKMVSQHLTGLVPVTQQ